jgi:hypothetical protein
VSLSSSRLATMPDIDGFEKISKAIAMLDAVLCPRWDLRYFSFNGSWSNGVKMACMRDGGGNDFFATISNAGAILKGFDHESEMTPFAFDPPRVWEGVLDSVPSEFSGFLTEPAFSIESTTFCIWSIAGSGFWQSGNVERPNRETDGSPELLWIFEGGAETYRQFAADYFEMEVPLGAVESIYALRPLTETLVRSLNPARNLADLKADIEAIGYP